MIRVMVVDDHSLVRDGLKAIFSREPDLEVVADAGRATDALAALLRCTPDVVLMDIGMQELNGLDLTATMLQQAPGLAVIILSMYDNMEYVQRAMEVGARGYLTKDAPAADILGAIRTVAGGGTYLAAHMAQRLFRAPQDRHALSIRERDILTFLAKGQSSKHIARALDLSVRTVEAHRQNIRRKLNLETQADLIKYAVENVHTWS